MFVIEVDGSIHDYKVEKTRQRNNQYILGSFLDLIKQTSSHFH